MRNLDLLCAKTGQEIAGEVKNENVIRAALGVLQEDGVYACFLYLLSENKRLANMLWQFLKDGAEVPGVGSSIRELTGENITTAIGNLAQNLQNLLFAKELLEQTLIYARYHAKISPGK